ncbi:hypothetical protein Nepgr_014721 [Nepenthes gracilis]|uniref:Uncharacterized protein n=1 Tax=Nepenthes gracilis TaxID=150966 RepID=A0AAD3SLD0_NEPGR|nr:hypothetical protein Nepgr_014721 [Nepenthes gracilis]
MAPATNAAPTNSICQHPPTAERKPAAAPPELESARPTGQKENSSTRQCMDGRAANHPRGTAASQQLQHLHHQSCEPDYNSLQQHHHQMCMNSIKLQQSHSVQQYKHRMETS